jgi:hypothetical protein
MHDCFVARKYYQYSISDNIPTKPNGLRGTSGLVEITGVTVVLASEQGQVGLFASDRTMRQSYEENMAPAC